MMFQQCCGLTRNYFTTELKLWLSDAFLHRKCATMMSPHPNTMLFPSATCTRSRGSGGQCRGEQRGGPGSEILGVFGEFSCGGPPPSPVACPWGIGGGVLITTLSLFDPTDSMAVRPPGKTANSCMLIVKAQGPDVTTDTWRRAGKLFGISSDSSQQPCDNHWLLTVRG